MSAVDSFIGRRIRQFRWTCGVTQADIASHLGVGLQQIEAYERGEARITAVRLFQIAERLDVPVTVFFDGMGATPDAGQRAARQGLSPRQARMLSHFNLMSDGQQEAFLGMAQAMTEHLCQAAKPLRDTDVLWPENAREG